MQGFASAMLSTWLLTFAHADSLEGKVVGISDGDTITVLFDRHECCRQPKIDHLGG
jgi:dipeptide/tripeptide permease